MNNNNFVLYLHIAPNGKKYFGITSMEPKKRWSNGHGYRYNEHFWRAIQKYSWSNIKHIILADDLTEEEAYFFERVMISLYDTTNSDNGYNNSTGGEHSRNGCKHSEEAKKKISESQKGKHHSEETRRKISKGNKGKIVSEETRRKISEANKGRMTKGGKGRIVTEEWIEFIRESQKGIKNNCARPVICLTTKRIFSTTVDAAKYYNLKQPNVTNCCIGKTGKRRCKSAGKTQDGKPMVWRYLNHRHNNIYYISGGYFVDNEKIARLIEESFDSEGFDLDSWQLFDDVDDAPIDYENLSDII